MLCPKSGVTWERESKFKAGGALHGCEQSYKAYQDFLQIITDDDLDGSRGWPFHMTGSDTRRHRWAQVQGDEQGCGGCRWGSEKLEVVLNSHHGGDPG